MLEGDDEAEKAERLMDWRELLSLVTFLAAVTRH